MSNLKPCPFCGGKAELINRKRYALPNECYVLCLNCGASSGADYDETKNVIKQWNTRVKEVTNDII